MLSIIFIKIMKNKIQSACQHLRQYFLIFDFHLNLEMMLLHLKVFKSKKSSIKNERRYDSTHQPLSNHVTADTKY